MRSYKIIVEYQCHDVSSVTEFYSREGKSNLSDAQKNSVFEHLILAAHQLSALETLCSVTRQADIARISSVAWYYGVYAAITAMVAAQEGKIQEDHTQTANSWDRQIVQQSKILWPFDMRISSLVKKDADREIDRIRVGPKTSLIYAPKTVNDAKDCIAGYLSGTRAWWAWRIEERIKASKEFQEAGFTDFRRAGARTMRDTRLQKQAISFAHQAIRYRGKANYREALFLAHGRSVEAQIQGFVYDMAIVLKALIMMSGIFALTRIGKEGRSMFLEDLIRNKAFTTDPCLLWGTP
jgi:hypothetical protein